MSLKVEEEGKPNSQFLAAEVRGSLAVRLGGRGVAVAPPHGAELSAQLSVVPAPLFHPQTH